MTTETTRRARELRASQTDAERFLWGRLRNRRLGGFRWRRQAPVAGFFADFACVERRLIVELDGSQHGEHLDYDQRRTAVLQAAGWRVIRFWNDEVFDNLEGVCEAILLSCQCGALTRSPDGSAARARVLSQGRGA